MSRVAQGWFAPALVAASAHVGLALLPVSVGARQEPSLQQPLHMSLLPRPEPEIEKPPEPAPPPPSAAPIPKPPETPSPTAAKLPPEPIVPEPVEPEHAEPEPAEPEAPPLADEVAIPEPAVTSSRPAASPPVASRLPTTPDVPVRGPKAQSPARIDWSGYHRGLRGALETHRRYPAMARRLGMEGTVRVRVILARSGKLAAPPVLARSSGHELLDKEALRMVQSAAPFPALPPETSRDTVVFEVPVGFSLRP